VRCVGELEEEPVDPPAIYAFSMENNGSPPPPSSSYSSSSWLPSLRGGDENPVHRRDGGGDAAHSTSYPACCSLYVLPPCRPT
jgi:hypothetical protein